MNGLRVVGSWAMSPIRLMERTSSRILGAGRFPAGIPPISSSDRNQSMTLVNVGEIPKLRFFARSGGSDAAQKRLWKLLAAGLLGLGGATFIFNDTEGVIKKSFLTSAHCAGADDCKTDQQQCVERTCDQSDCLRKTDREEEIIAKANAELEKALKDTKPKAVEFTEAALKAYCAAIEGIKVFMNKTYCAVEEENLESPRFEEVWCDVYEALTKRCELVKVAMEKGQCAWELLRRLREIIENGKACKYTSCNPLLVTAEETLMCAEKELCNKKAAMDCVLKESRVVEQYRNIVEEFRRDLKAEADSLVPHEDAKVTLSDNEANMIFTHAYKKILRVQKEMNNGQKC